MSYGCGEYGEIVGAGTGMVGAGCGAMVGAGCGGMIAASASAAFASTLASTLASTAPASGGNVGGSAVGAGAVGAGCGAMVGAGCGVLVEVVVGCGDTVVGAGCGAMVPASVGCGAVVPVWPVLPELSSLPHPVSPRAIAKSPGVDMSTLGLARRRGFCGSELLRRGSLRRIPIVYGNRTANATFTASRADGDVWCAQAPSLTTVLPSAPVTDPRVVEVNGLRKQFRDFVAVEGVSLHVDRGEVFGLLGPNGAGKTTTMRMLLGVLKPDAGTARIGGHDCFGDRERVAAVTGYLPDEPFFHDYLRGREILQFVGEMHGLSRARTNERARDILDTLEFGDALEEFATNYSRGMKKKLALACALLHEPKVLILDEPTSGLDPGATRRLHDMLRSLSAQGVAILLSSHVLEQVEKLCARVAIIANGRLMALLSMDEVRAHASGSLEELFLSVTGHGRAGKSH